MTYSFLKRHWWAGAALRYLGAVLLSYWLAWLLRFDLDIPKSEYASFYRGLVIVVGVKLLIGIVTRFQVERVSHYQGFLDLTALLAYTLAVSAAASITVFTFAGPVFPRSIYLLDPLVWFLLAGAMRFAARLLRELRAAWSKSKDSKEILIYGAGVAGVALAREIRLNPNLGYHAVGFLDDDESKTGMKLMGLSVFGSGGQAAHIIRRFHDRGQMIGEIVVAMPSATGHQIRAAVARGKAAGVPTKIVPGLGELISGKLVGKTKEVSVTDILGREPVSVDLESVLPSIEGRVVMVTGAAGSIGSELCSQLATLQPRCVVALDNAETPLFALEAELNKKFPFLNLVVEVGDIRDLRQMEQVVEDYAVDSIFHAAAYKHVPMMERQVCEAVRNNVIGTWNLVQAAQRSEVSTFLLISSDKAVNPSSIMGLTKRVAELAVLSQHRRAGGAARIKFLSVRFGNVLVSNGSVVPTFQRQISSGGPVTVTHPDMRRYFMTVQEAVHLVLRASTMSTGGEIFVLEMGKPVHIVDLATNMIRLAGFVPGEDIEIQFTGLRPGEKLFEELSLVDEDSLPTSHPRIRALKGRGYSLNDMSRAVAQLDRDLERRDAQAVLAELVRLVPEYRTAPEPLPVPDAPAEAIPQGRTAARLNRATA